MLFGVSFLVGKCHFEETIEIPPTKHFLQRIGLLGVGEGGDANFAGAALGAQNRVSSGWAFSINEINGRFGPGSVIHFVGSIPMGRKYDKENQDKEDTDEARAMGSGRPRLSQPAQ